MASFMLTARAMAQGTSAISRSAMALPALRLLRRRTPAPLGATASRALHGAVPMDGNTAAAHAAYGLSDMHPIFPITPASLMGEKVDEWNARGVKNVFGQVPSVIEMQSEMGAAAALHGGAMSGGLVSTFTSSQGLLLMIPNLFRLAGGLLPSVIHVASRSIFGEALSIFCDHADVMACRSTNVCMMSSHSPQEAMDLGTVCHLSTIQASVPFLHFFDGFRTSHEINTVLPITYEQMGQLVDHEAIQRHRDASLNPEHPYTRGTAQSPEQMFQIIEASHPIMENVVVSVEENLDKLFKLTGRRYRPFDYVGHPEADRVLVVMGSGALAAEEMIHHALEVNKDERVGLVKVHLFRPFSIKHLQSVLPPTVRKIAVLDRTREPHAAGDPLYLDVCAALSGHRDVQIVSGRFGIGGKEFSPVMAGAVLDLLKSDQPQHKFLVGINDDVSHRSISIPKPKDTTAPGTQQCIFWGIGADGTVGANKKALDIIVKNTPLHGQAYFEYSPHKSGGVTISHVRFGKTAISGTYKINTADYVACHHAVYMHKFPQIVDALKEGGIFLLNSPWKSIERMESELPDFVKRMIARKKIAFYTVDASEIAEQVGLRGRINMVMQSAFFELSGVLPSAEATQLLKEAVRKEYIRKGEDIVRKNEDAIDQAIAAIEKIEYPDSWAECPDNRVAFLEASSNPNDPPFVKEIMRPLQRMEGDSLPVSLFDPRGIMPPGTTKYEKRGFAPRVANWSEWEKCSQCNMCAFMCPHAAIRPFYFTKEEAAAAPPHFDGLPAAGSRKAKDFRFRIQVSPYDCTGCEVCMNVCPDNCITMEPFKDVSETEHAKFTYALEKISPRHDLFPKNTVRGSQEATPLLEFHGACAGCGESALVKLVTQLYGDQMFIANTAGCSCVWAAWYPLAAFTTNEKGHGPAYGQGLFEDCAEFGLGTYHATLQRRRKLRDAVQNALSCNAVSDDVLKGLLTEWDATFEDRKASSTYSEKIQERLDELRSMGELSSSLTSIYDSRDMLAKKIHWCLGGDGWANDIGFGGLDHVLASGVDLNVLVLDNEVYANTGGQASKSTPRSSMAKFAMAGKNTPKKDLGAMMMTYGYVYVASVCFQADPKHALKAIQEAAEYDGPSIVIGYAPCIAHGITDGLAGGVEEAKKLVKSGYVILYRFNPDRAKRGLNPLTIDSPPPDGKLSDLLKHESRYEGLRTMHPDIADVKQHALDSDVTNRYKRYTALLQAYETNKEM